LPSGLEKAEKVQKATAIKARGNTIVCK
jgi:hypothetical protein